MLEDIHEKGESAAIMSDAGTPLVSDPGYQIVRKAIQLGMQIVPIPGPSAALAALVGSGLPCDRFSFEGFLPDKSGERQKRLDRLRDDDRTLIFYVAPHSLRATLGDILASFGDRPACMARELTKLYEEFRRESLSELFAYAEVETPRGEIVIIVGGALAETERRFPKADVLQRLQELLASGGRLKDVASVLSKETGWASSELYKLGLDIKEGTDRQA